MKVDKGARLGQYEIIAPLGKALRATPVVDDAADDASDARIVLPEERRRQDRCVACRRSDGDQRSSKIVPARMVPSWDARQATGTATGPEPGRTAFTGISRNAHLSLKT